MSEEKNAADTRIIYHYGKAYNVDEKYYYEYYRPIWREVKRMKKIGKCFCPKKYIPYCMAECYQCQYYRKSTADISYEEFIKIKGGFYDEKAMDYTDTQYSEIVDGLITELSKIDEHAETIVRMKLDDKLDKEIAEKPQISTSTFSDRKKRLHERTKKFFEEN